MSRKLATLRDDIYGVLSGKVSVPDGAAEAFSHDLVRRLVERLTEDKGTPSLRLSNLGKPCGRQLWYTVRRPDLAEPLPPYVRFKFLFGDIIEAVVLFLARVAGHSVTDEQKEVTLHGVVGHIDGLIDGDLVDVKSASSYSFKKFDAGLVPDDDAFGYLTQLGSYAKSLNREGGAFVAVDKQFGHITVDHHTFDHDRTDYEGLVAERREMLSQDTPPRREFNDEPEGRSGNRKLGIECSYCPFREACWPGLRTFVYAAKPVYLTHVAREPNVPEKT